MWQRNLIFVLGVILLISSVSALDIVNSTTSSTITWNWTGNDLVISNLSIDGMEVCGISPSLTNFFLSGLGSGTTHTIEIIYQGDTFSNTATTLGTPSLPGGYSNSFTGSEIVRINQSSTQDPTGGKGTPWILWILSGYFALAFILIALLKPRAYHMDYEINIILSVIAWPFLWYWTWGALTSIDYIVGVSMADVSGASVMITQHIYYSFPILGWIGVGACIAAVFITILLISQFRLFKENDEQQKQKQRSENV